MNVPPVVTGTLRTALVATLVAALARPAAAAPQLLPRPEVLAATGPRLLVLVVPLDATAQGQAGLLEHAAETAVLSQGRFSLLRGADAFDGRAARARQDAAEKARQLEKDGAKKLDELDAVGAAQTLTEAVAAWRSSDLTQHFKDFVAAWALRGGAYATGDENVRARQDIERIIAVAPDTQLSNAFYPPDHLKYAESLRKQAQAAAGELTVRSEPPGARIWVDGAYRGVAPVTVKGLAAGRHFVTGLLAGRSMKLAEVGLDDELLTLEPAEGAVHWRRTLEKVAKDPAGPGRDIAARELAAATGAEQVLLLTAQKGAAADQLEVTGLRLEARDGHSAAYARKAVPLGSAEAIDALAAALLAKDAPRANGQPVVHHLGGGGVTPTRRLVGLSVLGGGVALAVVGVIFGGLALGKQEEYRQTIQVETLKAEAIASQGRAFAVVCDITLITGLVAAAGGAVIGFTTLGQSWFSPGGAPPPRADEDRGVRKDAAPDGAAAKRDESQAKDKEPDKKRTADEDKKAEEKRAREEDERRKKDEEEARAKKGKKDKKAEAEEKRRKDEEEKRAREEEERKRKEEDEARKKAEEDERKKEADKKNGPDKRKDDERRKEDERKREEESRRAAEEEAKKAEEAKKKKAEEEAKKKAEEDKRKKKGDPEDHDDLRNY